MPPNVLLYVDNSSSMTAQVFHPDWSGEHTVVDGGGTATVVPNKNQTQCEFFRETARLRQPHLRSGQLM